MYIIAGLGNPGTQYEGTRHNTGFSVIDTIAEKAGIPFDFEKYKAICGKGIIEGEKTVLVKPLTFMNLSGESISQAVSYYKIRPENELIVIYDDIDLDVGRLRIRENGSAGGHNGMKNIIALLGTDRFIRVRVGVGAKPAGWDLADWVLNHFSEEDRAVMKDIRKTAADSVSCIIKEGAEIAMNRFNR